jgi:hypothetical protein
VKVGELVEFLSAEGKWKPAVVVKKLTFYGFSSQEARGASNFIRLQTGPSVFIIRCIKCRGKIMVRPREEVHCEH